MSELNETAPPPAGFGLRPGRSSSEPCLERRPHLVIRGSALSHLNRAIEAEIIPRLVMAHGQSAQPPVPPEISPRDAEVIGFAELMLGAESGRAAERVQAYRDRGVPLETIYLDLFVPVARHLRQLWLNDQWGLAEIALSLWRLQQLVRDLSPAFCADAAVKAGGLRALLTLAPSEKHEIGYMLFGLVLAGEFFRRGGWETWIEPEPGGAEFVATLRCQWFDVVEFFANSNAKLDDLAANIRTVRRESVNRDIGVMVCGPAFMERPELVLLVGGDAVVSNFNQEALQARNVVNLLTERR